MENSAPAAPSPGKIQGWGCPGAVEGVRGWWSDPTLGLLWLLRRVLVRHRLFRGGIHLPEFRALGIIQPAQSNTQQTLRAFSISQQHHTFPRVCQEDPKSRGELAGKGPETALKTPAYYGWCLGQIQVIVWIFWVSSERWKSEICLWPRNAQHRHFAAQES